MLRRVLEGAIAQVVARRFEDWQFAAAITADTPRGRKFKAFGTGSLIAFPWVTIYNEHYIEIGNDTMLGPHIALSAGMMSRADPARRGATVAFYTMVASVGSFVGPVLLGTVL
ncbi:MAG: hypothetical protein EBX51_02890, partial [Acidimicrobiia bacterium]|nr:hypothetical protein [Acidimicrobiia bacterium]